MATSMSAQVEEAVCAYVLALRARGGHLAHAGGLAQRMARRILRLNARDGYTAEKPLEPLLEAGRVRPGDITHRRPRESRGMAGERRARKAF